ncbi:MAG: glycosyltransferase family 39 protein [Planctomycetaceae bacterium]|nr:glycosyltransferase family 39 protein [Planctomycetaceae bacterium]
MSQRLGDTCVLVLLSGLLFLTNLGGPKLWDRDEPRNAGCASEMLQRNDWVTPTFNAQLRPHKPVLLYWGMMVSYSLFGATEFAARLPSALCGTGSVLLTYFIGRRLFSREAGMWAAIALATTMMFGVAARAATPDALLIFLVTLALGIYAFTTNFEDEEVILFPRFWPSVAMYLVMGLATLAKGPIGFILPTAIIGMFLLIRRLPASHVGVGRWWQPGWTLLRSFHPGHFLKTCLFMRPLTAILSILAVALPWYLWVHVRTEGAWTYGFFIQHNVRRATSSMEGHGGGVWFYPVALLVGFFPWSVFWIPALHDGVSECKEKSNHKAGYLFAACWVGVYLVLFTIAKTKLPSYITPCYPGVALLMGVFLSRLAAGSVALSRLWTGITLGTVTAVGVAIAIAIPKVSEVFLPGEALLGVVGAVLIFAGFIALIRGYQQRMQDSLRILAGGAIAFSLALFAFAPMQVNKYRGLDEIVSHLQTDEEPTSLLSFACLEPSWVYYAGQPIEEHGAPEQVLARWQESLDSGEQPRIITTQTEFQRLRPHLQSVPYHVESTPYFLKDETVVVLSPGKAEPLQIASDGNQVIR